MPIRAKHRSPELPALLNPRSYGSTTVIKMDRYMRKDLIEMLDAGLSLPAAFQKSNQLVVPPPRDHDEAAWGVRTLADQRDFVFYKFGKRLKIWSDTACGPSTDDADSLDVNLTPQRKRRCRSAAPTTNPSASE
uniref:Uncharacterized protein n=1 Tax=Physcomitrium patens TaxID=3218 RepID=A0A7I4EM44_PHYPA